MLPPSIISNLKYLGYFQRVMSVFTGILLMIGGSDD